jgi:hypothetical protein
VTDAFEAHEKLPRLADADVAKAHHEAPWAKSYTAAPLPEPPLAISAKAVPRAGWSATIVVRAWSTKDLGPVTIEVLDHHRHPVRSFTKRVGKDAIEVRFPGKKLAPDADPDYVQGLHVRVGAWNAWDTGTLTLENGHIPLFAVDQVGRAWGGMKAPTSKALDPVIP